MCRNSLCGVICCFLIFPENTLLPNFVKENFVGKSVMRTRCLECEASTYRSETFTNIDIPLTFDANDCHVSVSDQEGSDCQNDVKDLFLKQIMASETLRENNKYWCSECSRLNEAQRSVQYELLPQVMVSILGLSGISEINFLDVL